MSNTFQKPTPKTPVGFSAFMRTGDKARTLGALPMMTMPKRTPMSSAGKVANCCGK
jgi:hypothetical protein